MYDKGDKPLVTHEEFEALLKQGMESLRPDENNMPLAVEGFAKELSGVIANAQPVRVVLECEDKSIWMDLPARADMLEAALRHIGGPGKPYSIADCKINIASPLDTQRGIIVGGDVNEVNYLAARLASLSQEQIDKLEAVMETPGALSNIAELIDFTFNPDFHELLPGVHTVEDLARHYLHESGLVNMPDHLKKNIDPRSFGASIHEDNPGVFTSKGYLSPTGEAWREVFEKDRRVPPAYIIDNHLATAEKTAEGNYNQIDGQINNAPPRRPDLTDGQTHDEIAELVPEAARPPQQKPSLLGRLSAAVKEAAAHNGPAKEKGRDGLDR